jgi:hypothetical protein
LGHGNGFSGGKGGEDAQQNEESRTHLSSESAFWHGNLSRDVCDMLG